MTASDEDLQAAHATPKEDPIRFVETLADEHDYWMSLTDAARVTRTSEAMTRRWVTSGRLPVKQEPVGINQRTRLVRASDVARIRPIVDPTAAITDDIHKLDLLSIPRQQAHITQEHQSLVGEVQALQQLVEQHADNTHTVLAQAARNLQLQTQEWERQLAAVRQMFNHALEQHQHEALSERVRNQALDIQRNTHELSELGKRHQHDLGDLRTGMIDRLAAAITPLQEMLQEVRLQLERLDQDRRNQRNEMHRAFTDLLHQQEEQFHHALCTMEETLAHHEQERQQAQHDLLEKHQALSTQQQTLAATVERHVLDIMRERAALSERMERRDLQMEHRVQQLETAQKAMCDHQERAEAQDRLIQSLTTMLQDESKARTLLSASLAAQEEQMQAVRRESGEWSAQIRRMLPLEDEIPPFS